MLINRNAQRYYDDGLLKGKRSFNTCHPTEASWLDFDRARLHGRTKLTVVISRAKRKPARRTFRKPKGNVPRIAEDVTTKDYSFVK